ncbi:MAG TPA: rod shape-determining protein MreC [Acidimicrobiales bacterium]
MSLLENIGRRRTVVLILVLLSVTLITFDLRGNGIIDGARGTALDVFAPVRGAGRTVARPFSNAWHGLWDYDNLKRENDALRDQIDLQQGVSIAAEAQVREYQELLALNGISSIANVPTVMAQVVSRPASNFELTVEINQGSSRGIRVGMPVVTSAGLVGRITRVTPERAVVRLITDPELDVAVKVSGAKREGQPEITLPPLPTTTVPGTPTTPPTTTATTAPGEPPPAASLPPPPTTTTLVPTGATGSPVVRDLGSLHGQGRGRDLVVDFIDTRSDVQVGDAVATSGVDESLSPEGIPVGRVSFVRRTTGSFQLEVRVEPAARLDDMLFVKVLLYAPDLGAG